MGKIKTLESYLAEHEFLREAAEFHSKLEKKLAGVKPLDLPPREEVLEFVKDGVPLLQQEKFKRQILDATEEFLPHELAEGFLRQESSDDVLSRKIFWAAIDKLIPAELKHWERDEWQKNYCPICGRRPIMAQLRKFNQGRTRYLLCGGCRTLWNWKRLGCPYCGNENLERIHILELNNKIRLDVCDEDEKNIYLRDWTTLHLDLLAEEKNLRKCGAVELE